MMQNSQKGFTLAELLISTSLLFMLLVMGTAIFSNIQSHLVLAQKEARMQQYARDAMTQMSRELRQAKMVLGARSCLPTPCSVPEKTDIYAVVPDVSSDGTIANHYRLVRYWFQEDHEKSGSGIMSLYRAWKNNGTSPRLPDNIATDLFSDHRTRLLKEAAALNPGNESYFRIAPSGQLVDIVLIVATYMNRANSVVQSQIERKFRVDTRVQIRGAE